MRKQIKHTNIIIFQKDDIAILEVGELGVVDREKLFKSLFNFLFIFGVGTALGLHCCVWAFATCSKGGYCLVVVPRLIATAFRVAEHWPWSTGSAVLVRRLRCSRACGLLPDQRSLWIQPVSPALTGGFLTTGPPGKSSSNFLKLRFN